MTVMMMRQLCLDASSHLYFCLFVQLSVGWLVGWSVGQLFEDASLDLRNLTTFWSEKDLKSSILTHNRNVIAVIAFLIVIIVMLAAVMIIIIVFITFILHFLSLAFFVFWHTIPQNAFMSLCIVITTMIITVTMIINILFINNNHHHPH